MLVRHAQLNNTLLPVNNWSAFALLEANGGFVIDLSGTRLGWLVFFPKFRVDMLSTLL